VTKKADAPGGLEHIRAFANTLNVELGTDALGSTDALTRWLVERQLLEPGDKPAGEADLRRAHELREALHALLLANNGVAPAADVYRVLSAAGARGKYVLAFAQDGAVSVEPSVKGADGALARIVAVVHDAMREGTWERMKACRDSGCEWAFYDNSKNRSAAWCSMEVCGNRNKVRLFRTRSRAEL
jgi:predicted RNA-binding Zn ribbon-like protein